jgi:enterobactin synthetase component D
MRPELSVHLIPQGLAARFIHDIGELAQVRLTGVAPVVALGASFDIASYADGLYDALGIIFPAHLARAVNKRKAEFLCGRYLAALALQRLGRQPANVGIGEHRQPLWPAGICGSLTHTKHRAACLMSADTGVGLGIDIEELLTNDAAHKIARTVIDEAERTLLESSTEGFGVCFTAAFSAKESLFKALYPRVGAYFDFHAARVIALDWAKQQLVLELIQDLGPLYRYRDRFQIGLVRDANTVMTYLVHLRG